MPLDEVAWRLGIAEVRWDRFDGFEGMLLTDRRRSAGRILVNTARGDRAARFTLAHEIGHFLLERHVLEDDVGFCCSRDDLRAREPTAGGRAADRRRAVVTGDMGAGMPSGADAAHRRRQEAEANRFAIGLLVPEDQLARYLAEPPDLEVARTMRARLDVSLEAALRCLVERHDEPLAAVWTQEGRIRSLQRNPRFPWIERAPGEPVASLSRTAQRPDEDADRMHEVAPAAWTKAELPGLFEQVHRMQGGHAVTLLWATRPDEDEEA